MAKQPVFVPESLRALEPFIAAGLLDSAAVQVAEVVGRTSGDPASSTALAAALATRAVTIGHVCVVLDDVAASVVSDEVDALEISTLPWPSPDAWATELKKSPAVQVGGAQQSELLRPLVLDGPRLYLERYWRFERHVSDELRRRAEATGGLTETSEGLEAILSTLFAESTPDAPDLQRLAAAHALTRPLTVIAGGPGTGKTRTVAAILLAAYELAAREGRHIDVALAAPTAKAAGRISAALLDERTRAQGDAPPAAVPSREAATTLHRLLGATGSGTFTKNAQNPLVHDLVIVDETSMVSLPLMAKLLSAMRAEASLVLVGDPFQLTSVEAGAVLGEVSGLARGSGSAGPLSSDVILLEEIHRFQGDSAIAELAQAIRSGDGDVAIRLLREGGDELAWVEPSDVVALGELNVEIATHAAAVIGHARLGEVEQGLLAMNDTKVLCATRHGALGLYSWTQRIEEIAARALGDATIGRRWYVGRPVIVTRNDYLNQTVNGDTGLVVQDRARGSVVLQTGSGERVFATSQLGEVDTWWAMTIHKSQGSEFRNVVISLPPVPSPILTRELLYTAVTRAKSHVSIVSSEASLRSAIDRPVARASGLGELLWPG